MFGVPFQYTLSRWVLFTFSFNPLYPLILVLSYSYFVCISSLMHVHSCNLWWLNDFIIVAFVCLYTICRILLARLEYLRETFQIKEGDFLTFDALVITLLLSGKTTPFHCHLLCCQDISNKISWNKFEISLMSEASSPMCWPCDSLQSWLWDDDICWQEVLDYCLDALSSSIAEHQEPRMYSCMLTNQLQSCAVLLLQYTYLETSCFSLNLYYNVSKGDMLMKY